MEETVDGCVLRSVPRGRGSPAPERAVFRLATQRRAARHLGAQRRGGGTEIDASPPCQPAPLLSPSRLLILPVPTWSSSELWSQRRSLCVGETQLVCVCVWRYQPVWSELWPHSIAASQRLEKSVIAITQTLNLKSRSGAEICHGTSLCWGMDGLFEVILSKATESHELIQLKFKHLEHRNWNHKAFTCSAPLTGAESNQAALNLEKVNITVRMCIIRVTTALIHIKTLPWILHIHVLLTLF